MKKILITVFCTIVFLCGCTQYLEDPFPSPQSNTEKLVFGLNTFGLEFYKELKDNSEAGKNFVISPYSISNCLAMVYAGARNKTEKQIAEVLHYTLSQENLAQTFLALNSALVSNNNIESTEKFDLILKLANSGWLQEQYPFLPSYINTLESSYGAKVSFLDFVNNYEIARDTINQWVDNETHGKISELIPKALLNSSIKLVLVNTVYFKGSWQNPFDERLTVNRPFYLLDGRTIDVPTMTGTESVAYLEGKEFQAVSLPFVDQGSLAMVILLPNKGLFEKVEQEVTAGGLYSVIHHMQSGEVNLHIPKFYVRTNRKLNDNLTAMGMPDVFSSDTADLSGIDNGFGNLFISFVIHEAVVTVNEKGAEAAAATAAGGAGGGFPPPKPVEFIADHPFIYAIYDRTTDAVLFLGRILVPEQDKEAL